MSPDSRGVPDRVHTFDMAAVIGDVIHHFYALA